MKLEQGTVEAQNIKNRSYGVYLFTIIPFVFIVSLLSSWRFSSFQAKSQNVNYSEETLKFTVVNEYTAIYGDSGKDYPWIEFPVVEPYRTTFLDVITDSDQSEVEYIWIINDAHNKTNSNIELNGQSVTFQFTELQYYLITLTEVEQGTNKVLRSTSQKVVCRYVRREMRTLTDGDREAFFSGIETLINLPSKEGKELYGDKYNDYEFFTMLHNHRAGDRLCDHMHDGAGFMTSHAALTLAFEQALQAINPILTVPYWDYTIDTKAMETAGGDISDWYSSIIFDDDWFGEASPTGKVVTRGRFSYLSVSKNMFNISSVHNAYGFLRAPWNQNKIPYVTRSSGVYGFRINNVPSCSHHYNLLQIDSFERFTIVVPYAPHGSVHIAIGGIWGANWVNHLENWGYNMTEAVTWGNVAFSKQKNIYRLGVLECPTYCSFDSSNEECKCHCPDYDLYAENENKLSMLIELTFGNVNETFHVGLLSLLCNHVDKLIPQTGDHLESASPADPSFWPIHPTIDRLFQWKRINGFTSMAWKDDFAWSVNGYGRGYCMGHNLDDVIGFDSLFGNNVGPYTNSDLLMLMNPENDYSPYIYDNFRWDHCVSAGFPADLIGSDDDNNTTESENI